MAKNYTRPQLTTHGNIEELTQITGSTTATDSVFSSSGNVLLTGSGGDPDITAGGPVTVNPNIPTGVPIS